MKIIMTGHSVEADEAERIGLVNAIAEGDLIEAGHEFAGKFTRYSLPVLECARSAVQRGGDITLAEGLCIEADLSTLAFRTADAEEGMATFE